MRTLLALVLGYAAMALALFALFTGLYAALGVDGTFQPGTYATTTAWNAGSVVLGFVAACLGGFVAVKTAAPHSGAPRMLAGLVLLLTLANAVYVIGRPDAGPRRDAVANVEAMQKARQPGGVLLGAALLGMFGVLTGAGWDKKRQAAALRADRTWPEPAP